MKARNVGVFVVLLLLFIIVIFFVRNSMAQLVPIPISTVQTDLTKDMRTICIGRLMMDIPEKYYPDPKINTVKVSSDFNLSISTLVRLETAVSLEEFNQRVNAQWNEINGTKRYHDMSLYDHPPQKVSPRVNGYILAYGFGETYGTKWVGDEIVKVDVAMSNDAIGFYWVDGTMFTIKNNGSASTNKRITDVINNLSSYDWSAPPQKPGICLYQGFFEKYYDVSYERTSLSIDFTDQLGFSLITEMGAGRDPQHPTRLDRTGNMLRSRPEGTEKDELRTYAFKVYRADEYNTQYFKGEEIVNSESSFLTDSESPKWTNEMLARWEVVGDVYMENLPDVRGGKLYYPNILFQMGVKTTTTFKPQDFGSYPPSGNNKESIPTQEEFFELWDAMVNSIRPYPDAFTPKPTPPKPEERPGPSAAQKAREQQILDDFLKSS